MTAEAAAPLGRAERGRPLFFQLAGLLVAVVLGVQALNTAVLIFLPAPRPEVFRLDVVAQALREGRSSDPRLHVMVRRDQPHMVQPGPRGPFHGGFERAVRAELVRLLGVPEDRVFVASGLGSEPEFVRWLEIGRPHGPPDRGPGPDWRRMPRRGPPPMIGDFRVALRQPDGTWMTVSAGRNFPTRWQVRVLLWIALCLAVCLPIAFWFARRLAAPITGFAQAAERLGRNTAAAPIAMSGPAEIRVAISALNEMQLRLRRYVENRTTIIGAIAHDLRTPLARLRFLLERPHADCRADIAREVDEMESMVAGAMAFVREETEDRPRRKLDFAALVASLVDDLAETGAPVTLTQSGSPVVMGDVIALRRLTANLIRNAVMYGERARVFVGHGDGDAILEVEDDGPGIPATECERVFEPFHRLEASRNRDTGGLGLGLAVVRSVARAHGGEATVGNGPRGGLICHVTLPLER